MTVSGVADAAGNAAPDVTWSFTTEPAAVVTIFGSSVPAVASASDTSAVELGTRFTPTESGLVTGVRFYKGPGNTGTHVGRLWNAAGDLLGTVTFAGGSVSGNLGDGLFALYGSVNAEMTSFSHNTGGGIVNGGGVMVGCEFVGNGGVGISGGVDLTDCTIIGNAASFGGGGIYCSAFSCPTLINSTIACNSGPGLYSRTESLPTLTNCILWGNEPSNIEVISSSPIISFCAIQGGWEGAGNIDEDPHFVDSENGDFHLLPSSPCIDSGSNEAAEGSDFDLDGNWRNWDGDGDGLARIDMGAYEFGSFQPLPRLYR